MKLAFYKATDKPFNWLVSWWDNGPYSHCEILGDEVEPGTYMCYSSSAMDGGVRSKVIKLNPKKWDIVEVDADMEYALYVFRQLEGCKYDYIGLVGFLIRIIPGVKKRFFCSELCAKMLGMKEAWRFSPNALFCAIKRY